MILEDIVKKVLIVEDDSQIRGLLSEFLRENEFEPVEAKDGREGSAIIAAQTFDCVLMDMMLPFKSGDELIKALRECSDEAKRKTPVIVLSARSVKDIRLKVLRMGADDYIVKPFDLDEVLVRMEVVLRRSGKDEEESKTLAKWTYKTVELDTAQNTVTCKGEILKLTQKEQGLLELFLKNPAKTFTKANLYEAVWEETYCYEDNTINVHMSNLRSKLKKAVGCECIETVWGIGYRLVPEEAGADQA